MWFTNFDASSHLQFLDGKDTRVPGQQDTKKVGGLRPILSKIVALSLAVAFPVCMWYLARDSWQETIELFQKEGLQDSLAFMGHLGWVGRVGQRLVAFFLDHMRQKHWTWVAVGCASFLAHLSFLMPALVSEFDHRWQQYLLLGCIAGNNAALLLAFAGEAPLRWLSGLILVAVAAAHVWNTAMEDPEADLFAGVVEHLISNAGQGFLTALQILLALHMFLGSTTGASRAPVHTAAAAHLCEVPMHIHMLTAPLPTDPVTAPTPPRAHPLQARRSSPSLV